MQPPGRLGCVSRGFVEQAACFFELLQRPTSQGVAKGAVAAVRCFPQKRGGAVTQRLCLHVYVPTSHACATLFMERNVAHRASWALWRLAVSYHGIAVLPDEARKQPGVTPTSRRKAAVKWLWSAKPTEAAIPAKPSPVRHSSSFARSTRRCTV